MLEDECDLMGVQTGIDSHQDTSGSRYRKVCLEQCRDVRTQKSNPVMSLKAISTQM
jgi:hypothetical protein